MREPEPVRWTHRKPELMLKWREPWAVLARYNTERARGLLHAPEWQERMAVLQREFDEKGKTDE